MKSTKKEYEKKKQYVEENKERINEYKRLNYHKNKKEPTEEEIEAKRLRQEIRIKNMRDKLYEKRAKIRENPNYEEEKKQRQLELHRIANKKYNDKKKEAKKQSHT